MPVTYSAEGVLLLSILESWVAGRLGAPGVLFLISGLATGRQDTMQPANFLVGEIEWRDEDILLQVRGQVEGRAADGAQQHRASVGRHASPLPSTRKLNLPGSQANGVQLLFTFSFLHQNVHMFVSIIDSSLLIEYLFCCLLLSAGLQNWGVALDGDVPQ